VKALSPAEPNWRPPEEMLEQYLHQPDQIAQVEKHLAVCPECQDEVRNLRSLEAALRLAREGGILAFPARSS
jgi:hypothetical protein